MVIELGGKQFVAEPGSRIIVNQLDSQDGETIVTKDLLSGKEVKLKVLKSFLGDKVHGLKFKNKVRYTRRYGHRQQLTQLEVMGETAKIAPTKLKEVTAKPKTSVKKTVTKKTVVKKTVKAGKK
ncbi:MAG: bL21 family ribosomal protein [Patescibacteria group bacterium]